MAWDALEQIGSKGFSMDVEHTEWVQQYKGFCF